MTERPRSVQVLPVIGMPEVAEGDDLADLIGGACSSGGITLETGDVVVVSSKVASKALGLRSTDRSAAVDASTVRVVAERVGVEGRTTRVVEALAGPVMAAGGVDASNTGKRGEVLLLPGDPDAVAADLLAGLVRGSGLAPGALAVVLSDTAGRPWRDGQVDFALGAAGLTVVDDLRGGVDADGRALAVTARAVADEIAAAADLVKGKTHAVPVAVVRGLGVAVGTVDEGARRLVRTGAADWFRVGHIEAVRAALGAEPGSARASEVGIRSVEPETLRATVDRAVRLAVQDASVAVVVARGGAQDGVTVQVGSADGYLIGRVVARLEAALWSEDLAVGPVTLGDGWALVPAIVPDPRDRRLETLYRVPREGVTSPREGSGMK